MYYEKRITQEELGNIQSNLGRLELIEKNMAINNYRQVIEIIAGDKCILTICFDADAVISVNDRFYLYDDEVYNYFFLDYNEK
ncbi:MAG: hypothetical protein LBJ25_01115 [Candidatus Margulisbacteria bacterium]|nr:hypothetical protein [Candidatus Margulisiibacteriota bacterium]